MFVYIGLIARVGIAGQAVGQLRNTRCNNGSACYVKINYFGVMSQLGHSFVHV